MLKKNILLIFPLIFLISVLSCKNNPFTQSDKNMIINTLTAQQDAWNKGDIKGYMQGYLHSDSLRFASGSNVRYGWENTYQAYLKGYPSKEKMGHLSFSNLDIKLLSKRYAVVFGAWKLNRRNDSPHGLFTLLFVKQDNKWLIFADHTSSAKDK